jgi:3-oxoacyl-[acyl-carrier protein] reductase
MNEQAASDLYASVCDRYGASPSALVCAAGRLRDGLVMQSDFATLRTAIEEHLLVPMALSKAAVKSMYKDRYGRIVFLSSISARYVKRGQGGYTTAKAGIEGFLKVLALEVAHRGITVNAVAPGLISTPMTTDFIAHIKEKEGEDFGVRIPAGRVGTAEEVGEAIGYLCSDAASYITGTVITIDGGRSLGEVRS